MPASVAITSPGSGTTVGSNFTAQGTLSGVSPPVPSPPPLKVRIEINGQKYHGVVSLNDSGAWTATFTGVPAGTNGEIFATWQPDGAGDRVDDITVQ